MTDACYQTVMLTGAHHGRSGSKARPEPHQSLHLVLRLFVFIGKDAGSSDEKIRISSFEAGALGSGHGMASDKGDAPVLHVLAERFMGVDLDTADIGNAGAPGQTGLKYPPAEPFQCANRHGEDDQLRIVDCKGEIIGDTLETGGANFRHPFRIAAPEDDRTIRVALADSQCHRTTQYPGSQNSNAAKISHTSGEQTKAGPF